VRSFTAKIRQYSFLSERLKFVEHVDEELVKTVFSVFVSQSTSFKTAFPKHCPLLPVTSTFWDQEATEALENVPVEVVCDEVLLILLPYNEPVLTPVPEMV
jgi:hypothetical protein